MFRLCFAAHDLYPTETVISTNKTLLPVEKRVTSDHRDRIGIDLRRGTNLRRMRPVTLERETIASALEVARVAAGRREPERN